MVSWYQLYLIVLILLLHKTLPINHITVTEERDKDRSQCDSTLSSVNLPPLISTCGGQLSSMNNKLSPNAIAFEPIASLTS